MKPLKVEFQAFGPYTTKETVDFNKLSSKGLFLISGDTGTGKTTILDAITFALYGKSSGGGRDSFEQMRCKYAPDKTPTFVRFEFENNGQYFIFERTIEKKRVNFQKSYCVKQKDSAGNWQVLFENTKETDINKKAVEIIGLEYNQFVQVIILPQGKFEEFLVSSSDDKAKILTSIFGEEKWQEIAKAIYDKASKKVEELSKAKTALKLRLAEENCETIDELRELIENKKQEADTLKSRFEQTDYSKIIKDNQELLALIKRFEDLDAEEEKRTKLSNEKAERGEWEKTINNAKRAAKVKLTVENALIRRKELTDRSLTEEKLRNLACECQKKVSAAEENYVNHISNEKENEEKKKLIATYEAKKSDYEGINSVLEDISKAQKDKAAAEKEENIVKEQCESCDETIVEIKHEYEQLKAQHNELVNRRFAGMVSELARELEDGKPCPVCGSTEHYIKVEFTEENVTKEQVDIKQKEVDIKYNEMEAAGSKKTELDKLLKEKHKALEESHSRVVELKTKYEGMKKNMLDGVDTLEDLLIIIRKLTMEIETYADKKIELENAVKIAKDLYTENKTKAEEALREMKTSKEKSDEANNELLKAIKDNGFASEEEVRDYILKDDEIDRLTSRCADYDAAVKNNEENLCKLKSELDKSTRPDKEACEKAIMEATEAREEYARISGVLQNTIDKLVDKEKQISSESEGMEKKISLAEENLLIAKRVCGYTGIGLQRYVLGIMFSSVVTEANKMLKLFNGGRYRLFRTDEKKDGSNKSGLELKVFDKYSDDENGRFVHSLSGGEKFLTSLALSIGMSAVARRGGIKIEAMFIDEGFGTLDNSCVEDAMNILDSVKKANGVVGIISHMEILRGRIPTKLMAVDDGKGSHLVQTIG